MLNISLKILDGLGWNFIFRLYLCNTLFQQTLKNMTIISEKFILSIISRLLFFPSMFTFMVIILCSNRIWNNWLSFKKKLYYLYFRSFSSFTRMFTFIMINFCWWNLVLNISLKILDGLGWNLIFKLYLCNTSNRIRKKFTNI